ncbi:hypothetical protein KEJ34_01950 [Candidatus Bathyarchaeota archaeon]|nr:hypothetical protein [Candidatus Bathyarchaeota archaeon]
MMIRMITGLLFGTSFLPLLVYLLSILSLSRRILIIGSIVPKEIDFGRAESWISREALTLGFMIDLLMLFLIKMAEGSGTRVLYRMLGLPIVGSIILHVFMIPYFLAISLLLSLVFKVR